MYWKLAIQNIRRSLRDYIIYLVTLTLTAALMYSFLALGFSSDVLAMAENMSMLTTGILLMSALVAFMSSFVIGYAIRFMLGRRKKEFATYELIGMEAKTVRNLFLAENSIIGTGAFLLGSLVGTGLSGLLNQVVKNIFEVPHTYQVSFSLRAWAVTFFFFVLMAQILFCKSVQQKRNLAILLTISLATMFVGLTMGAGYKANMKAYYPYDAGVAIDAPLEKSSMDSIVSFTEEHCGVEDSVSYYLYAVPEKPIEALSLSDYNHLREILGLSPVSMSNNEFLVHCDTWNYMDGIR